MGNLNAVTDGMFSVFEAVSDELCAWPLWLASSPLASRTTSRRVGMFESVANLTPTAQTDFNSANNRIIKAGFDHDAAGNLHIANGVTCTYDHI